MPQSVPPGLRLGVVEPQDAIAAFERRRLLEPSFRWQDVWQDEHARGFAVAGVMRMDVLQALQDEVALSVREGRSLEDFRSRARSRLVEKGFWGDIEITDPATGELRTTRFNDSRLRTIFDVNMRQSQAAGRWQRIDRTKRRFPFIVYRTMRDERVRASHAAWDNVVLPVDHPWWNTHYPPCGWRCRCTAFAVSERDLERRRADGEKFKTEAPPMDLVTYVNPSTGEVAAVPRGIDPGFAYNPGKARDAAFFDAMLGKAVKASPLAGAVAVAQATQEFPAMLRQVVASFGAWVDPILDQVLKSAADPSYKLQLSGLTEFIGAIKPQALRELQRRNMEPASAAIAVRDADVAHALDRRKSADVRLPDDDYKRLPELLTQARALLLERGQDGQPDALLYVVDLPQRRGRVAKVVCRLDVPMRVNRSTVLLNHVRTVTIIDPQALQDRQRYELIWGTVE